MVYDDMTARKVEQAVSDVIDALHDAGSCRYAGVPLSDVLATILSAPPDFRTLLPAPQAERAQATIDKAAALFEALSALRDRACFLAAPISLPVWSAFLHKSRELLAALRTGDKALPEIEYRFAEWTEADCVQDALTAFPAELDRYLSEGDHERT